ncbi:MAG: UDP-N-acetylmuramoyl-tripeptide--D-alanyl-D-alanine ligase [Candidatus Marinimicrobia bacterium]|nr:UDP-N-acetylmuramoyl-tripeptide--D-alanyl-D-alanine ligase [Candidatus Neomarinimicrobiota bacterium]
MLKKIFKKIIVFIITLEARLVLKKYKPKIIAVTGSAGKTSTKDAIAVVLKSKLSVRKSHKSFNSEVGVPLTVLGCKNGWLNFFVWLNNIVVGLKLIMFKSDYPEWLVLELGVERPKDMERLVSWVKPHIAVVTTLSETPSHVEFFPNPGLLIKEKSKILKNLEKSDYAILNNDNDLVLDLKNKTKARIVTYGFSQDADLIASNYHIISKPKAGLKTVPEGIAFKVDSGGSSVPVRLFNVFGKHHVHSVLAAIAVGKTAGLNFVDMLEALYSYQSPPGRFKMFGGVKNSFIIDDTYNSSPIALRSALETLGDVQESRKIVVLGDMLELGKYTIEAHKAIAENIIDAGVEIVFVVGPRAKFIAESLREKGFNKDDIFEFSTANEAKKKVEEIIREGDIVLVKGSQSMRMERVVEEIMAEPQNKEKLLVRQEKEWLAKP